MKRINCYVFVKQIKRGKVIIDDLIKEYKENGINVVSVKNNYTDVLFDNGERWLIFIVGSYCKGFRWQKAIIDRHPVYGINSTMEIRLIVSMIKDKYSIWKYYDNILLDDYLENRKEEYE